MDRMAVLQVEEMQQFPLLSMLVQNVNVFRGCYRFMLVKMHTQSFVDSMIVTTFTSKAHNIDSITTTDAYGTELHVTDSNLLQTPTLPP